MRIMAQRLLLLFTVAALFLAKEGMGQQPEASVYGVVEDSTGSDFPGVNVAVEELQIGTITDSDGAYQLSVPSGRPLLLQFTYLNSVQVKKQIGPLDPNERLKLNIKLSSKLNLQRVEVSEKQDASKTNMTKIDPEATNLLPNASGSGVQTLIKTLPGVSSSNELSSSYSVRGGNYDENMIYINDVEIYRPFLVNGGRQEGLSIVNSDLVGEINFSAGGFEARYGDKMSSVLDITYKRPDTFAGSATGSLLGGRAHVEGSSEDHRFTYLLGVRYRSNQYLVNSLDVEGNYDPVYADVQSYLAYDINPELEVSLLTHYGNNQYTLNPESRSTDFGTPSRVLRLNIFFEGEQELAYQNLLNAATLEYQPNPSTTLKFITSVYQTQEYEYFDILGQYRLSAIETNPESDDFQEPTANLGVGSFLRHARNELDATIYSAQHKGTSKWGEEGNVLKWGLRYQRERIQDEFNEWRLLDSAGYSLPRGSEEQIQLDRSATNTLDLSNNRLTGYLQNTFTLDEASNAFLTAGVRGHYWDYNQQMLVSPRVQFTYEPNRAYNQEAILQKPDSPDLKPNITLRASGGSYQQPPFYREFRTRDGSVNPDIQAQRSYHAVAGLDWVFDIWGRPFRWSSSVYYKHMEDLIPYTIDDIRIRYFGENSATGYAVGWDNKIYGEFVKGLPSWLSLSIMQTKADIDESELEGDQEEQGYIRRPQDQRVQFGLYFQDFLPNFPEYKVFLNTVFGSNLPLSPPDKPTQRGDFQTDAYSRVDIGFSRRINTQQTDGFLSFSNNLWVSLEVLNLLNTRNTVSYFWARDIRGGQWAIPNYSTARRVNLKLKLDF